MRGCAGNRDRGPAHAQNASGPADAVIPLDTRVQGYSGGYIWIMENRL